VTSHMRASRATGFIAMSVAALAAVAVSVPGSSRAGIDAFDPGDIIVADSGHDAIKAVDPVTGVATPVSTGGSFVFPADVAFADDGDILVVDRDAFDAKGGIIRVDSVTAAQTTVSNNAISDAAGGKELLSNPIALDRKGGSLYVADFHRPQKVIKVNIETGKQSLVSQGKKLHSPFGIVAADVAKPLVADADAGVIEVNPKSGKQSVVSSGGKFKFPSAIALMEPNAALVADPDKFDEPGAIFKVDLRNGHQKTLARGGPLANPVGVALIDDQTAAVSDTAAPTFPAGGIYRVDLETGDQTLLNGTDFSNPLGVRVAP
jgi:hypothetical protein